jgi:hypothetical protein
MLSNRYSKRQIKKKNYRSKLRGGTPTTEAKIAARKKKEDEARKIEQDKIDQRREQELRKEQEREKERQEFKDKQVLAKTGRMAEEHMERQMTQPRPTEKKFVKLSNDLLTIEGWLDKYNSGNAVVTLKSGDIYNGDLLNGLKHGEGTFLGFDGEEYTGHFFDDKANGFGIEKYPCKNADGSPNGKFQYYEGNFLNDRFDGKGKFTGCNGQVYIGDFKNHKKNGFGKQNYLNGSIYEGEWKDDKKHGIGKLTEGDTIIHQGRWENDNAVSK